MAPSARPAQAQENCASATEIVDFIECLRLSDSSRPTRCAGNQSPRLLPPVKGTRVLAFGQKTQYGTVSKGVAVQVETGAEVQAPVDGMVFFAQQWRTYGMLIIIDACTIDVLLAGAHSNAIQAGTLVKAGDTIARMSDAPGAILYWEVRSGGKAIDPAPLRAQ